jgi:magnesium-transporting ATPase (P-type)
MSYALSAPMTDLVACPFCRQLFEPGEASACPDCGLGLKDLGKLPPSYDARVEYPEEPIPPHMESLPWTYAGRNRALLLGLCVAGFAAFFAPWVHESAPELRDLTGYTLARMTGFFWAPAVAWFVLFPLVLTRRSIYKMRGARVAVAFLAGIALVTVVSLLAHPPRSAAFRPVHIEWQWGIYAAGAAGLAAVLAAFRFGGKLDDLPTVRARRGGETLH